MNNKVSWSVDLVPENAGLIDQVNQLLLGKVNTTEASTPKSEPKATTAKQETAEEGGTTFEDLKDAAKSVRADHGDEFANKVLEDLGIDIGKSLGANIKKVSEDQYDEVIKLWEAGPQEEEKDDEDDLDGDEDDLDGEDSPAEVDPDAVKEALRAMSKSKGKDAAKKLMAKYKIAKLGDLDDSSQDTLAAILKEAA